MGKGKKTHEAPTSLGASLTMEPPRPRWVRVAGKQYAIEWLGEAEWETMKATDNNNKGSCDTITTTLSIRTFIGADEHDQASPSQMQETLTHEIIHAVNEAAGLWYKGTGKLPKSVGSLEEAWTTRTAPLWLQVIRDNPIVWQWLQWDPR
jgi:hypothetical protein